MIDTEELEKKETGTGIACPNCGHTKTRMLKARRVENARTRRLLCLGCNGRFMTKEILVKDSFVNEEDVRVGNPQLLK